MATDPGPFDLSTTRLVLSPELIATAKAVTPTFYQAGGERSIRVNESGSYVVVPKGVWHTARPRKPTNMLFVTPGEGTLNIDWPEGRAIPSKS